MDVTDIQRPRRPADIVQVAPEISFGGPPYHSLPRLRLAPEGRVSIGRGINRSDQLYRGHSE